VRDNIAAEASKPSLLYRLDNMYPDPLYQALLPRPGFQVLGGNVAATHGANRGVLHTLYKLDGTIVTVMIVGSTFWLQTTSGGTRAWTAITTGTTPALPSDFFATTSGYDPKCEAISFANVMILRGWLYMYKFDGTTFTKLTAAPLMDSLTVYYAKLFGIKHTDKTAFVWSEENDPTIGYEYGGYNNAWTLGQTGSEPLQAMAGANEALYYWRGESLGSIRGEVSTNFSSEGTREGVSSSVGTIYPDSLVAVGQSFWFLDRLKRPYKLPFGGELVPLWADCEQEVLALADGYSPKGLMHPCLPLVLFAVTRSAHYDRFLVFHSETGAYFGTWSLSRGALSTITSGDNRLNFGAVGVIRALDGAGSGTVGDPRLAFWCGEGIAADATASYVYEQTPPVASSTAIATIYNDVLNAVHGGTLAVIHWVESGFLGAAADVVKLYRALKIVVGQTPDGNGNTADIYVHRVSPNPTTYKNDTYAATGIMLQPFDIIASVDAPTKYLWYCYAPNGVVRAAMTSDRWPVWYFGALTETDMTAYRGGTVSLSGSNIPADKWGAWSLYFSTTGTLTVTAASGNATGYATAALARAGCTASTDEQVAMSYIAVRAPVASAWVPNTSHNSLGTTNAAQAETFYRVDQT
jgi:hypothetical protein